MSEPTRTYLCRYLDPAPPGAGGWLMSDFIKDPSAREGRFEDYEQTSADKLFADVTVQRAVSADRARRDAYRQDTAFSMAYDALGWHLFVRCGEPDLDRLLAAGANAGSLELYLAKGGAGETYSQWIISLPDGDTTTIEWNSPHRGFRPLKPWLKTQTVTFGTDIAVHCFVPWEALYDRVPLQGGRWPFGFIRWTPAGGITWGGKVHETGRWGQIEWAPPTPGQSLAIRTNLVQRAWARYRASRDALAAHWTDPVVGDPGFYETQVGPVTDRLTDAGAALSDETPDASTVDAAWSFVKPWFEFPETVDHLRHEHLATKLTTAST